MHNIQGGFRKPMTGANLGKARFLFQHPEDFIYVANPWAAIDHTDQWGNEEPKHTIEVVLHRSSPRLKEMMSLLKVWEQEGRCRNNYTPPFYPMADYPRRCEPIVPYLEAECKKKGTSFITNDWVYMKVTTRRTPSLQSGSLKPIAPEKMQSVLVPGAKINLALLLMVNNNRQPYKILEGIQYLSPGVNTKEVTVSHSTPSPFTAAKEGDYIDIDEVIARLGAGERMGDMYESNPDFQSPFQEASSYTEPVVVSLDDDTAAAPF